MNEFKQKRIEHILCGGVSEDLLNTTGAIEFNYGKGIYLYDEDGNKYIDAMSGAWVVNVGHGNKEIIDEQYKQSNKLAYLLQEGYFNESVILLSEKLSELTRNGLRKVFFTCGGSEAVESALKIVRQYCLQKLGYQKHKILARKYSYHGATMGAMSVTGFDNWRELFNPSLPGVKFVPHPYCYHCEFGMKYPHCALKCIEETERVIVRENPASIGAFIAEPISMSVGTAIPPKEYWKEIRRLCDKYGILLIADEIITAFGRTGKWFALENWGIEPDLMVIGKGLTSGYSPLAGVMCSDKIAEVMGKSGFVHGFTYSGHPVACAVALKNISIIEKENLLKNALDNGRYLEKKLNQELASLSIVDEVRVYGLLATIELVEDKKTKKRLVGGERVANIVKRYLMDQKIICRVTTQVLLGPPLVITIDQINILVESIKTALKKFSDYYFANKEELFYE
ncbi:aspartate aminotransferase family protein [Clostridium oryzae]|uniref:Adenosylmethionine-8-amino-7-oxononanoate aminotransferase n=1 Tax=Clostridium oryzae TaxID=1450648 RepID=A0A1V4IBY5_9CLOT|nr:aspartate aminotransferase family protein [Clostridium oryzae]OPJ57443.1 adenosylmethionine-8-amino-7-oxononanoate aminotransferase [Clostridium oryzae]